MKKSYTFYHDPGHGWLKVPRPELKELGIEQAISSYSYQNSGNAYLEEDCDASRFIRAAQAAGWSVEIRSIYQERTRIRDFQEFSA